MRSTTSARLSQCLAINAKPIACDGLAVSVQAVKLNLIELNHSVFTSVELRPNGLEAAKSPALLPAVWSLEGSGRCEVQAP